MFKCVEKTWFFDVKLIIILCHRPFPWYEGFCEKTSFLRHFSCKNVKSPTFDPLWWHKNGSKKWIQKVGQNGRPIFCHFLPFWPIFWQNTKNVTFAINPSLNGSFWTLKWVKMTHFWTTSNPKSSSMGPKISKKWFSGCRPVLGGSPNLTKFRKNVKFDTFFSNFWSKIDQKMGQKMGQKVGQKVGPFLTHFSNH